jgi:ubiquinone/menaquinone biosynthesis C-methylase UbiE
VSADPEQWQLEGTAPELYQRYLVPAVTLPWAEDLVERVGLARGDRVLDVACGTGVVARHAAARVGDGGRVVGLDVNTGMLEVARAVPSPGGGSSIEWVEGSATALPFATGAFTVVLCQLGLQFFDDRRRALREMRRVLEDGGRVGASVFTAIDRNPAACALADAIDRQIGEHASLAKRSEHALADADELRNLLSSASFTDVAVQTVALTVRFASVEDWVGIQFAATPLAALQSEELVDRVSADVRASLAAFERDDGFAFPQEVNVAIGTV